MFLCDEYKRTIARRKLKLESQVISILLRHCRDDCDWGEVKIDLNRRKG
jgi:hypothetical protein